MTFYATEIDICPAYGWEGGPNADVRVKKLKNRHERRNRNGDLIQHTYVLPFRNIRDDDYLAYIKSAFMALGGPTDSFLVKDYGDYLHGMTEDAPPMVFGRNEEGVYQLSKRYRFGDAFYDRPITKPVLEGLVIYVEGVATDAEVDLLTGEVVFATADEPGEDDETTWSGEFRVPVRFADFSLPSTLDSRASGSRYATNGSCSLVEVFGE